MHSIAFFTVGCKVNQYETDAMISLFQKAGYRIKDFSQKSDIYIVNSCSVTNEGARKSRQITRKAFKKNPNSIIGVIGCYPQTFKNVGKELPEADIIIGTKDKSRIVEIVGKVLKEKKPYKKLVNILEQNNYEEIDSLYQTDKARAFLKIQDGCNQFCAYCIVPYARGPIKSRDMDKILKEANYVSSLGYKEIVLTGINIGKYGKDIDNKGKLLTVVEKLNNIDGIKRIRFGSIEPNEITYEFIQSISQMNKVCRHFHIPLQSGSNNILKLMNRPYSVEYYKNLINYIREMIPYSAITTDVIVGFPGETYKEYKQTLDFVNEIKFRKIHCFKFSRRKNTKAYNFKNQLSNSTKSERNKRLIELSLQHEKLFLDKFIGKQMKILVERESDQKGFIEGHTDNYLLLKARGPISLKGEFINVIIKERNDLKLIGEPQS